MLWQGEDNGIRYACTHTLKKRAHQATLVGRKRTMGKKLLSQVHGAREGQNTESDLKKVRMVMGRGGAPCVNVQSIHYKKDNLPHYFQVNNECSNT